jgi:hypothetical protein
VPIGEVRVAPPPRPGWGCLAHDAVLTVQMDTDDGYHLPGADPPMKAGAARSRSQWAATPLFIVLLVRT